MSIAAEITRLTDAKAALRAAIQAKGVTVAEAAKLEAYAALVESIEAGGGGPEVATLVAIKTSDVVDVSAMVAPTGWTAVLGSVAPGQPTSMRVFTAPASGLLVGDFFNIEGQVFVFRVPGTLRVGAVQAYHWSNSPGINAPTPSVDAVAGDTILSFYQELQGANALGAPTTGYTRIYERTDGDGTKVSVLSRESAPAGATGPISHNGDAQWNSRWVFTGAFEP